MKKIIIIFIIAAFCITFFITFKNTTKKQEKSELTKIKVAEVTHSIFYAPMYLADSLGYFKENGLDVDIILTSGVNKKCVSN